MSPAHLAWLVEHRKRQRKAEFEALMSAAVYAACHISAPIDAITGAFGGKPDPKRNDPVRIMTALGITEAKPDAPKPQREVLKTWDNAKALRALLAQAKKKGLTDPTIEMPGRGMVSIQTRLEELA